MAQHYDVVVVGGGPAGSSAARRAAAAGASVLLVEKEPQIATTVRTSGVTWSDAVAEFGIPRRCYNPVRNYGFASPNNEVVVRDTSSRAAVLDVRRTYRWLASAAEDAGATILTGTPVRSASREGGHVRLEGGGGFEARARIVIDASGFAGTVAQSLGLAEPWGRFGVGAEYELRARDVDPETWWLMVGSEYSPAGYAWVFPVGGDIVRVGVGVAKPESDADPREILDRIMRRRTGPVGTLGETDIIEYHYGVIPNGGVGRRSVYDNVMLAGDSAGQANPLVLEGIRFAVRFGGLAGEVAAAAVASGDASTKSLEPYEKGWRAAAESRIRSAYRVQDRWLTLTDEQWDEELNVIRDLNADEFLDFVKAEFAASYILKMAIKHPRLAVRQLFGLVRR